MGGRTMMAKPIVSGQAHRDEDEDHAGVGRVAGEAEDPGSVEGLRVVDGDVGAEGSAEGVDGCPADEKAEGEQGHCDGGEPESVVDAGGSIGGADPHAKCDGGHDGDPEDAEGAAVADGAAAGTGAGAGDEEDVDFGGDPGEVERFE
jgi:hypothetical protein